MKLHSAHSTPRTPREYTVRPGLEAELLALLHQCSFRHFAFKISLEDWLILSTPGHRPFVAHFPFARRTLTSRTWGCDVCLETTHRVQS